MVRSTQLELRRAHDSVNPTTSHNTHWVVLEKRGPASGPQVRESCSVVREDNVVNDADLAEKGSIRNG